MSSQTPLRYCHRCSMGCKRMGMRLQILFAPWDLWHLKVAQTWLALFCLNYRMVMKIGGLVPRRRYKASLHISCHIYWTSGLALSIDGKTLKSLRNEKLNLGQVCQVHLFLCLFSLQVLLFPAC